MTELLDIKKEDIKVLISYEDLVKRIKEVAKQINQDFDGDVKVFCVLKGAVMFTTELVKHLDMPLTLDFIRLSSYGNDFKSTGRVSAVDISVPDLNGKNVLIVEDIIDTGHTAKFLLDFINANFKTKSTKFCAMLDKKCSRQTDVDADYSCFEIDNKFIVGFGLDYKDFYRNIPYIGYVEV